MADAASISERNATPREQDDSIKINEPMKEFHSAADLTRFRNKGGILSTRELKELKARTKAREEMIELENRMRTIENAETPRSPERTTEPTDQQQKLQALLSHPLRHPYRPHLIPTSSQTPVRLIQNLVNPKERSR